MRRQPVARKPSRSLIPVLIAAAVLTVSAFVAAHLRTDKAKPSASAASDIAYVWQLSSLLAQQGTEDRRWLIRYDVGGMRSGDVLRAAGKLGLHRSEGSEDEAKGKELSGPSMRTISYEGKLLVERQASEEGPAAVPVAFYADSEEDSETIVIVQPPDELTADELSDAAEQVEAALRQAGGRYEYSFRVSGSAPLGGSADADPLQQLATGVAEQAEASLVERYEDEAGAAINETSMSPHIGASVETNGSRANLQVSVHRDSESGAADWVIGVPVITGDYSPAG